jgi:hypothetical protein
VRRGTEARRRRCSGRLARRDGCALDPPRRRRGPDRACALGRGLGLDARGRAECSRPSGRRRRASDRRRRAHCTVRRRVLCTARCRDDRSRARADPGRQATPPVHGCRDGARCCGDRGGPSSDMRCIGDRRCDGRRCCARRTGSGLGRGGRRGLDGRRGGRHAGSGGRLRSHRRCGSRRRRDGGRRRDRRRRGHGCGGRRSRGRRRSGGGRRHGRRCRNGCGCGRWRDGNRRRDRRAEHGQEPQRIEVALLVGGRPDPEMDVGAVDLRCPARADRADDRAFRHRRVAGDGDRAEMREGHREAIRRLDGHRRAARRHVPREADDARGRGAHRSTRGSGDVDAAVLARGVRMRVIEGEALHHRPVDGPRPGAGGGHEHEGNEHEERNDPGEHDHAVTAFVV